MFFGSLINSTESLESYIKACAENEVPLPQHIVLDDASFDALVETMGDPEGEATAKTHGAIVCQTQIGDVTLVALRATSRTEPQSAELEPTPLTDEEIADLDDEDLE